MNSVPLVIIVYAWYNIHSVSVDEKFLIFALVANAILREKYICVVSEGRFVTIYGQLEVSPDADTLSVNEHGHLEHVGFINSDYLPMCVW